MDDRPPTDRWAVLDFETTGLNPRTCDVIETGAVQVDGRVIGATFHALTAPRVAIPAASSLVHGIVDDDVRDAPPFEARVAELLEFLEERVIVAHHARFDCAFLEQGALRAGLEMPALAAVDTVRLSRRLFPDIERHDLTSLCATHGIRRERAHRALDDALATAELLAVLLERAEEDGLSLREVLLVGRPAHWRRGRLPGLVVLGARELDLLEEAILTGDVVRLGYLSARGRGRRIAVVPYRIDSAPDRLVGYDVDAGTTRIWPLDRVITVEAT
ncbi:MAG: exonuclease domain-containing protein [bacterium]